MAPISSRKKKTASFRDRFRTVLLRAHELRQYDAEVYVLVRRNGRITEYSSSDSARWPLNPAQVV